MLLERHDVRSGDDLGEHPRHLWARWRDVRLMHRCDAELHQRLVPGSALRPGHLQRVLQLGGSVPGRHAGRGVWRQRQRVRHLREWGAGLQLRLVSGRSVWPHQLPRLLSERGLSARHGRDGVWPGRRYVLHLLRDDAYLQRRLVHWCSDLQRGELPHRLL